MITAGSPGVACRSAKTAIATTPMTGTVASKRRAIWGSTLLHASHPPGDSLLWVPRVLRSEAAPIVARPPGRWRVAIPSGTLGPSLVDRPIGASSLHQTASPVGLPAAGT